ncbi:hypothetical protein ACH427_29585 [Streptomyces sp. NPDC020379]|uniref:hypothetical protein n=1 Tax=Streptomyces sp. NPDC020379 TaxID=3365071 RepID=UPI0037B65DF0
MSRIVKGTLLGLAIVGLSTAGLAAPQAATAAPSLKGCCLQVTVHTGQSDAINVHGTNQYGAWVSTDWRNTPNPWTRINNWWWKKGTYVKVEYQGKHNGSYFHGTTPCYIQEGGTPNFADCAVR